MNQLTQLEFWFYCVLSRSRNQHRHNSRGWPFPSKCHSDIIFLISTKPARDWYPLVKMLNTIKHWSWKCKLQRSMLKLWQCSNRFFMLKKRFFFSILPLFRNICIISVLFLSENLQISIFHIKQNETKFVTKYRIRYVWQSRMKT